MTEAALAAQYEIVSMITGATAGGTTDTSGFALARAIEFALAAAAAGLELERAGCGLAMPTIDGLCLVYRSPYAAERGQLGDRVVTAVVGTGANISVLFHAEDRSADATWYTDGSPTQVYPIFAATTAFFTGTDA